MAKTISVSNELYDELAALAKPFEDKQPEDVIRRLLKAYSVQNTNIIDRQEPSPESIKRAPRERGAIVELNGTRISATTVPDLCMKVMEFINSNGLWDHFESLAPYKTSAKRYLFSKIAKHPQGNDFFVPLKYKSIYMEAHKNYETTITQLDRLANQLGIKFKYIR